jgi:lipopolysaccharide kinase (Kdo/WaaP) family protein
MKKIVVNSEYLYLKDQLEAIPDQFDSAGEVIYKDRNILRKVTLDGKDFVIKSYNKHTLFNRFAYKWFRQSKAQRAYENSFLLLSKNINTPEAVAYIECTNPLFLTNSYCITLYEEYPYKLECILEPGIELPVDLLKAFAVFIFNFHRHNMYHKDFSLGNILFKKENEQYQFAIVDINRLSIKKMTLNKRIKSLLRLEMSAEMIDVVVGEYAKLLALPEDRVIKKLYDYKKIFNQYVTVKRQFKNYIKLLVARLQILITVCFHWPDFYETLQFIS